MILRISPYLLLLLFLCRCGDESLPNECELIVQSITGHHVVSHNGLTFDARIDSLIGKKTFNNLRPFRYSNFPSCADASKQADKDFLQLRPQIFQVNGFSGSMPYQNDVYEQLLGLYVQNTGCSLLPFIDCYNNRTWTLLNHFYGTDIRNELESIVMRSSCLAIDTDKNVLVEVTTMPTLLISDSIVQLNGVAVMCSCHQIIYGIFKIKVDAKGEAKVLEYTNGFFDQDCQNNLIRYIEQNIWRPAIRDGSPISSIVDIQFSNF